MKKVNIHEAKTQFSRLLRRVAAGEEITFANRGVPVARLVPVSKPLRKLGAYRETIKIPTTSTHLCRTRFWICLRAGDLEKERSHEITDRYQRTYPQVDLIFGGE